MSDLSKCSQFNIEREKKKTTTSAPDTSNTSVPQNTAVCTSKKGVHNVRYYLKQVRTVSDEAKYQNKFILVTVQYI